MMGVPAQRVALLRSTHPTGLALLTAQCQPEGISIAVPPRTLTYSNPATRARSRQDYTIDLQGLFNCLNRTGAWGAEPMLGHPVPVTGIHFGIEQDDRLYRDNAFTGATAPNALWIAVDGVRVE